MAAPDMAAVRESGRGAAAVLPPARCGRHSPRDTQTPVKTPRWGLSRGSLQTLLTCLQVCCLLRGTGQALPGLCPQGCSSAWCWAGTWGTGAGVPRACTGMLTGPRTGKHLHKTHHAVVALVSAKCLVTAGVPRSALPSSPLGRLAAQPGPGHPWVLYGAVGHSPMGHHHPAAGLGLCSPTVAGAAAFLLFPSQGKLRLGVTRLLRKEVSLLLGRRRIQNDSCLRNGAGALNCL